MSPPSPPARVPRRRGTNTASLTRFRVRSKVILGAALLAIAAIAAIAAVGAYAYVHYVSVIRYTSDHGQVTVESKAVDGHGTVLVTNRGFALYIFLPDGARHVTCTGGCAFAWPPLELQAGESVAAGAGVRPDLLGTVPDPVGGRVVTYHGWPLHTYLGDASAGHAAGQGKDDDGGYWYVMRPSGQIFSG